MKHWNSKLLEQLLQVQETDLKIRKLDLQVQLHNQRSKEEDTELSRIKSEINRIDETLINTQSQNQMYATTLEDIRAAIKGLLTTKAGVPKPRTRSSTEALKIEEEKLESLVEETSEQLVKLKDDRDSLLQKADMRTEELETHSDGPEAEIRKLQQQIRKIEKQREEEVAGIPTLLLKHYDRLRSSRSGVGLTIIQDGVCKVCCMQMPTAINSKLSHGEKIDMCPACGRMVARIEFNLHLAADEPEGDDSIDRPSRKLRKVKLLKGVALSRESADERKAALKKTLKKRIAGLDAARSEAEATSRKQAAQKKDVKHSLKKKVTSAAAVTEAESVQPEASKKVQEETTIHKASKKSEGQDDGGLRTAQKDKKGGEKGAVSTKADAKKAVVTQTSEKKSAVKAVKEKSAPAKSISKKSEARKPTAKKADEKKSASPKAESPKAAKKPESKKSAVTKPAAKKSSPKKAEGKKSPPPKAESPKAAKKSPPKKASAKKEAQKKPAKAASKKK